VLGGYVVQKIFFTLSGVFTYLYLFLRQRVVRLKFDFVHKNPGRRRVLIIGGIAVDLRGSEGDVAEGRQVVGTRRRRAGPSSPSRGLTSRGSSYLSGSRGSLASA